MLTVKNLLVILHVITAAAWFGLALRVATQARTAAQGERSVALAFSEYLSKNVRQMTLFITLTFAFGLAAMLVGGGFAAYPPTIHTSVTLIFVLILAHLVVLEPTSKKLHRAIEAGEDATSFQKRISMVTGIGHLIWLVVVVLMLWTQYALVRP